MPPGGGPCERRSWWWARSSCWGRSWTRTPPHIARELAGAGVDLYYKTTVGDNLGRLEGAIRQALGRAEIVITTGGIGPTLDDVTREAVAAATDRELVFSAHLMAQIEAFFAARGFKLSPSNQRQAYIPAGAIPIENPVGTAPAFIVEAGPGCVITLPGVPREMQHLLRTRVMPYSAGPVQDRGRDPAAGAQDGGAGREPHRRGHRGLHGEGTATPPWGPSPIWGRWTCASPPRAPMATRRAGSSRPSRQRSGSGWATWCSGRTRTPSRARSPPAWPARGRGSRRPSWAARAR